MGGLPTLQAIEDVETDNKDRPVEEIRLIKATVFVNPFEEADEEVRSFDRFIAFPVTRSVFTL